MAKEKKIDLERVVKKAEIDKAVDEKKAVKNAKPLKSDIPPLKEHDVEPVVKLEDKGNKPKGATKHGKEKSTGKTDTGTIKKGEEKPKAGKEGEVAIPDRTRRKRGFFDWFTDGGRPSE